MKRAIYLFIFLFIACSVHAFSLAQTSPQSVEVCPRDTALFVTTLQSDTNADFTLTNRGSASNWATTVPTGSHLNANEEKTIYTYVTPSIAAYPGTYNLDVVASRSGETKSSSFALKVKDCFGASLVSASPESQLCPSEIGTFKFTLRNTGAYQEAFVLKLQGQLTDQLKLSDSSVVLASGESKDIFVYVTAPKNAGEYSFTVSAQGSSGKSIQSFEGKVNVKPCYSFTVDAQQSNSLFCEHTAKIIPITIKNEGTTTNQYSLSLDGPSWVSLEKNTVALLPGNSQIVRLIAAPDFGVEGSFKTVVTVAPQKGTEKALTELALNVKKCHAVDLSLNQENASVCVNSESNYQGQVRNDGEVDKEYSFSLNAPSWVESDVDAFSLKAGEKKDFVLTASPSESVKPGSYPIKVNVRANDESKVSASRSIEINVVSLQDCFNPVLESEYNDLVVYADSNVVLPVTVENKGTQSSVYQLVMSGSATSFSKLTPGTVSLGPGKSELVYVYIAPKADTALTSYDLDLAVKMKDSRVLASKSFKVRITNDSSQATRLMSAAPASQSSSWLRFKSWLKRTFAPTIEVNVSSVNVSTPVSKAQPVTTSLNESSVKVPESSSFGKIVQVYRYWILGSIILILVVIILVRIDAHRFFLEEDDEDDE